MKIIFSLACVGLMFRYASFFVGLIFITFISSERLYAQSPHQWLGLGSDNIACNCRVKGIYTACAGTYSGLTSCHKECQKKCESVGLRLHACQGVRAMRWHFRVGGSYLNCRGKYRPAGSRVPKPKKCLKMGQYCHGRYHGRCCSGRCGVKGCRPRRRP